MGGIWGNPFVCSRGKAKPPPPHAHNQHSQSRRHCLEKGQHQPRDTRDQEPRLSNLCLPTHCWNHWELTLLEKARARMGRTRAGEAVAVPVPLESSSAAGRCDGRGCTGQSWYPWDPSRTGPRDTSLPARTLQHLHRRVRDASALPGAGGCFSFPASLRSPPWPRAFHGAPSSFSCSIDCFIASIG